MSLPQRDPETLPAGLEHLRRIVADIAGLAGRITALERRRANVIHGDGTPEASVAAPVGTLYVRTDGGASTTLYVKESGTGDTGWVAK